MQYLLLIITLTALIMLIGIVFWLWTIKQEIGVRHRQIKWRLDKIMKTQEEFDAQIKMLNQSLEDIKVAIEAEAKQIATYIEQNPGLDTSALDGVVKNLAGVSANIENVFTPPSDPQELPPVDPPAEIPPAEEPPPAEVPPTE